MTIEDLVWLRDGNSDEIPDKILHGRGYFKVRRNWWNAVVGVLSNLEKKGQIPDNLVSDVDAFLEHYTSDDFHQQPLTTTKDISIANNLLDRVLGRNNPH